MDAGEWVGVGAAAVVVVGTGVGLYFLLRPAPPQTVLPPNQAGSPFGAAHGVGDVRQRATGVAGGGITGTAGTVLGLAAPIIGGFFAGGPVGGAAGFASLIK